MNSSQDPYYTIKIIMWKNNRLSRERFDVNGHEEGCNYTQSNALFSQKGKMKDELYKIYLWSIERNDVASDEVSNECWSSEIGGASRRSHMGTTEGRTHKSYFLVIEKWVIYQ